MFHWKTCGRHSAVNGISLERNTWSDANTTPPPPPPPVESDFSIFGWFIFFWEIPFTLFLFFSNFLMRISDGDGGGRRNHFFLKFVIPPKVGGKFKIFWTCHCRHWPSSSPIFSLLLLTFAFWNFNIFWKVNNIPVHVVHTLNILLHLNGKWPAAKTLLLVWTWQQWHACCLFVWGQQQQQQQQQDKSCCCCWFCAYNYNSTGALSGGG